MTHIAAVAHSLSTALRHGTAAVLIALLASACSVEGTRGSPERDPAPNPTTAAPTPQRPPTASCEQSGFEGRQYVLCQPDDGRQSRLLIALHGRGSDPQHLRRLAGLEHEAVGVGMAVLYPSASGEAWRDDTFGGDADVRHLERLLNHMTDAHGIDTARVAVVGHSSGGGMALRLAAEWPDRIVAAAAVAGQLARDPAIRPVGRVPVMVIHGTHDRLRSYEHGVAAPELRAPHTPTPSLGAPETIAAFVTAAGSDVSPPVTTELDRVPDDGTAITTTTHHDAAGVVAVLHTVRGGGHAWPGARHHYSGSVDLGRFSQELDATAATLEFLDAVWNEQS